eukprot:1260260-Amphidinium_carterae.1
METWKRPGTVGTVPQLRPSGSRQETEGSSRSSGPEAPRYKGTLRLPRTYRPDKTWNWPGTVFRKAPYPLHTGLLWLVPISPRRRARRLALKK